MRDGRSGVSTVSGVASPLEDVGESGRAEVLGLRRSSQSSGSVDVGLSDLIINLDFADVLSD